MTFGRAGFAAPTGFEIAGRTGYKLITAAVATKVLSFRNA